MAKGFSIYKVFFNVISVLRYSITTTKPKLEKYEAKTINFSDH